MMAVAMAVAITGWVAIGAMRSVNHHWLSIDRRVVRLCAVGRHRDIDLRLPIALGRKIALRLTISLRLRIGLWLNIALRRQIALRLNISRRR